ncbi:MAG: FadR/GntR family transcriptional regulator [Rhodospirillaceae bacterium]|nr:FadR/GntR family transcriptional regulator [Rhodospirillaceae bacterium]
MARSAAAKKITEPLISPIRAIATYELVADQLRTSIILSRFLPGQKLPPERHLAAQLGVSRTTVREAVRAVEAEGLVETRRGATGGIFVRSWFKHGNELHRLIDAHYEQLAAIFEFRLPTECAATRLAAERRSPQELDELLAIFDRMQILTATQESRSHVPNIAPFVADDNAFHLLIARASRNTYLQAAVETARAHMFLPIGAVFERLEDNANDFHEEIIRAIRSKDGEAAEDAMRRHILSTRDRVHAFIGRSPGDPAAND